MIYAVIALVVFLLALIFYLVTYDERRIADLQQRIAALEAKDSTK